MGWLQSLATEFGITVSDGTVWLSIGEGLLFGAVCLVFGVWVARFVDLLESDAPAGETLGVGLASGLLVLVSWWAAVASGGRSSFTPVAVGFVIAIALALVRRLRQTDHGTVEMPAMAPAHRRNLMVALVGAALFIVAVALLYGSTLTLRPRDGLQPLEFYDEAYYSVLGADLARTGTESSYSSSGFDEIQDLPSQTWYHWGEVWLASAAITVFGAAPLDARYFVILPALLLAAAALTGTLVRRVTGSASRSAFLFGFAACLFLAPAPLARGLIFGITTYGLAAVSVLLAMYSLAVLGRRVASWRLAMFVGSVGAFIVPAHVVIAALALIGAGGVWTVRIAQSLGGSRRIVEIPAIWRRAYLAAGAAIIATLIWGLLTGHGVVTSLLTPSVTPFNFFWRDAVATTVLGAGAFLAIAIAWFLVYRDGSIEAGLYLGTAMLVVAGTVIWGARLGDFYALHLFFGGIAVFATPVAAVAVWSLRLRLRATGHNPLATAVLVLSGTQLLLGVALGIAQLQVFGPGTYPPISTESLADIRGLPLGAKLAYACQPFEETAFWNAKLIGLDAHTGRVVVPMCFEAESLGVLTGGQLSADVPSPGFQSAPQHTIYLDSHTRPSSSMVAAFLKANGVDYIYADAVHPNSLVPDAIPIGTSGAVQVLQIP